jgi:hypothetical protein
MKTCCRWMRVTIYLRQPQQVSKYCYCSIIVLLYYCIISNKQKRKQKGKLRVSEAVVVLGQEKQKKWFFFKDSTCMDTIYSIFNHYFLQLWINME